MRTCSTYLLAIAALMLPAAVRAQGNLSTEVLACVSSVLASATFPPPRGGHPAALEVPLTLSDSDAGL